MASNNSKNTCSKDTIFAGTMKGTIKHLHKPETFNFDTTSVYRRTVNGQMRVEATMVFPDENQNRVVYFMLNSVNPPTDKYDVGTDAVRALSVRLPEGVFGDFNASMGEINLQNHFPESRINGSLDFQTENLGGDQYDVKMVFEVLGID